MIRQHRASKVRRLQGIAHEFRRMLRCGRGVSAVEFSLLAPFLIFGMFAMVDTGMAVYEKMMISQVLRSGAQSAIGAQNETFIEDVLTATASRNFTVADDTPEAGELQIAVNSYCICPENTLLQVPCIGLCPSLRSPSRFYTLAATKIFEGVILPDITLAGTIDVMAN